MTFTDTMESMGVTNNAAKRPNMTGYAWKFWSGATAGTGLKNGLAAITDERREAGDFYLALVQRDGDQYIYKFDASTGLFAYNGFVAKQSGSALDNTSSPVAGTSLPFDAVLMTHIAKGQNWSVGKQSDFESVRTGGSGEW